jgi:hypothetical protein
LAGQREKMKKEINRRERKGHKGRIENSQ